MVVFAALLNPYPVLLALSAVLLCAAGWAIHTLDLFKTNTVKLISVIFADGSVQLESNRERTAEGVLDGQQWCTHQLAVLRIATGGTTRKLVILSAQQREADDFRRLSMWLRQGLCDNTRVKQLLKN